MASEGLADGSIGAGVVGTGRYAASLGGPRRQRRSLSQAVPRRVVGVAFEGRAVKVFRHGAAVAVYRLGPFGRRSPALVRTVAFYSRALRRRLSCMGLMGRVCGRPVCRRGAADRFSRPMVLVEAI